VLIVFWNALILHARWGGLVQARGVMNLAIFGNAVTKLVLVRHEYAGRCPA